MARLIQSANNSRIPSLYQSAKKKTSEQGRKPLPTVEAELSVKVAVPVNAEAAAPHVSLHALIQQNQHKIKVFTEAQKYPSDLLPYPDNDAAIWINPEYRPAS